MSATETESQPGANTAAVPAVVGKGGDISTLSKDELARWLSGVDLQDNTDTAESDFDLAMKILGADTLDKALEPDDIRESKSMVGKTFTILAVDWHRSTKTSERGDRRYAFLRCVDEDGVKFFCSCGATQVVLMLARLLRDNQLPATMTFEAQDTNTGNTMIKLAPPPQPS